MADNAFGNYYNIGTVSTAASSPDQPRLILGSGTLWSGSVNPLLRTILPGDIFWAEGYSAPIAEVTGNNELVLGVDWPGPALSDDSYYIAFSSGLRHEATEFAAQVIDVKERLRLFETAVPVFSVKHFAINEPVTDEIVDDWVVVGTEGAGAFAGHDNELARKQTSGWLFIAPQHGYHAISADDNLVRAFIGTVWASAAGLGVNVTYAGSWDSVTEYGQGDVVTHNGEAWIATQDNDDSEPDDLSSDWDVFVGLGVSEGFPYSFLANTDSSDPGSGNLKLNGAQGAATMLRVSRYDALGNDWGTFLGGMAASTSTIKGHVQLVNKLDQSKRWIGSVTAANAVGGPDYYNLTITAPGTPQTSLDDGDLVQLLFRAKGDKGDTGTIAVGTVVGGSAPAVINVGTPQAAVLNFTLQRGLPGGPIAIPYTVDANTQTNSNPGNGQLRFGSLPQNTMTTLRVSLLSNLAATVTNLLDSIQNASTSDVKANARLYDPYDDTKYITFDIIAVQTQALYRNLTLQVTGSSAPNPFAHGGFATLGWVAKGQQGDAATVAVGSVNTTEPGTNATVANVGTAGAAVLNFTFPRGDKGDNFQPQYVVNELVSTVSPAEDDRGTYDEGPVFDDDGRRLSVLVLSDINNYDLSSVYFLQTAAIGLNPAVWIGPFTFGVTAAQAADVDYDGTDAGLESANVQDAIDEVSAKMDGAPDPVAMAMIFGG